MEDTASLIAAALVECGGVQAELARRLKRHPEIVSRWCRGLATPRPGSIIDLARIAGIDPVPLIAAKIRKQSNDGAAA